MTRMNRNRFLARCSPEKREAPGRFGLIDMKGILMKYAKLLLVVLVLAAFVPAAFSQEPVISLKHKEMGKHERPIVDFNHEKHTAKIDCLQCHHDYDAFKNNRGGDGQACQTCHGPDAKEEMISLKDAFHLQCKGCHENLRNQGKPAGDVTCGGCHVRK